MLFYRQFAIAFGLLTAAIAGPAWAQSGDTDQERDYCPTRPGLGTTPCTIAAGHVSIETAVVDWTGDKTADEHTDTTLIGDTLVRAGLSDHVEAQLGWTPYGHERSRDRMTGQIDKADRVGDLLFGVKANLRHPDGSGLSVALAPFVTVPVGREPIGAGDWGGGIVVPVTFDLSSSLNLQFSPEVDAAVDEDGHGRHLAYGSVVGLGVTVSKAVDLTFEVVATQDNDPEQHSTQVLGTAAASWKPVKNLQFDVGTAIGLNDSAPDAEVYLGISRLL